jgi:DNA polymerase-3 subunit beta
MIIDTLKLQAALANIRPIVGRRQNLPILSCVKLHTERNQLHITGSNLDEFVVEQVEVDGEFKPVCVRFDYLSNALIGDTADITFAKSKISLRCGKNVSSLSTLDAGEFPPLPKMVKSSKQGLACAELSKFVKAVSWAASKDPSRYILNSVLIESRAKQLTVLGTNGREMAFVKEAVIGSDCECLIPSGFASNAAAALARDGAILETSENQIRVTHNEGEYYCKRVEGNFPNYKQVIPNKTKLLAKLNVEEMLSLLRGVACYGNAQDAEIKGVFKFSNKGLVVEFKEPNSGTELIRELAGKYEDFTVALATAKMLKIFQQIKTDEAALRFVDELSVLTIEAGNLTVLTMPIRLT